MTQMKDILRAVEEDSGYEEMVYPEQEQVTNMVKHKTQGFRGECKHCGRYSPKHRRWDQVIEWAKRKHPEALYTDEEELARGLEEMKELRAEEKLPL